MIESEYMIGRDPLSSPSPSPAEEANGEEGPISSQVIPMPSLSFTFSGSFPPLSSSYMRILQP
jgi:hypothetical protein